MFSILLPTTSSIVCRITTLCVTSNYRNRKEDAKVDAGMKGMKSGCKIKKYSVYRGFPLYSVMCWMKYFFTAMITWWTHLTLQYAHMHWFTIPLWNRQRGIVVLKVKLSICFSHKQQLVRIKLSLTIAFKDIGCLASGEKGHHNQFNGLPSYWWQTGVFFTFGCFRR